jgi:expansin
MKTARRVVLFWLAATMLVACSSSDDASSSSSGGGGEGTPIRDGEPFGPVHSGSYHLGPVDFAETKFHNSCAPYADDVKSLAGSYLAGVDRSLNGDGSLCDACALVTTRLGKKLLVRIVTNGVSKAPGDMDLSPEAYEAIHDDDPQGTSANPRPMTWQLAKCQDSGHVMLQLQTEASEYWTSLWVRNGRLPIAKLEVKSAKHATFFAMRRETDGTFNDDGGFGAGPFELRVTGASGATVTYAGTSIVPGALIDTGAQF